MTRGRARRLFVKCGSLDFLVIECDFPGAATKRDSPLRSTPENASQSGGSEREGIHERDGSRPAAAEAAAAAAGTVREREGEAQRRMKARRDGGEMRARNNRAHHLPSRFYCAAFRACARASAWGERGIGQNSKLRRTLSPFAGGRRRTKSKADGSILSRLVFPLGSLFSPRRCIHLVGSLV